jgi:mannose-6-phosphate isomerase-like protein (cupin superfamily)
MSENVKEVAMRMKALREVENITEEEMAKTCGVSLEEYIAMENGEQDFSIGHLFSAAGRLGVDVMELMTGQTPNLSRCAIVRQGEGVIVHRQKAYEYRHLAYTFRNKKVEPFMVTVRPNMDVGMPELNSHEGHEFDFIVEGKLCMQIDNKQYVLNPGDSIYFDSKYPHALRAYTDQTVKFLAIVMK